ncbi:hypothetical protein NIES970_13640 [[Synechococcus] sp. NIES-970]|nr:hypothetical protein NIES970_13640 [[Synechococcus] sp. NIES-970]
MSAIAVLCTLNCAMTPVVAEASIAQTQDAAIAQLPGGVAAQEIELTEETEYDAIQIQDRSGEQQQFSLDSAPLPEEASDNPASVMTEASEEPESATIAADLENVAPEAAPPSISILEVLSDRQEYNEQTQVVTATGNVIVRFREAVLSADQLRVNLDSKLAIATGNVSLRRGQQLLRGEQFTYFFVQNRGTIQQAEGEVSRATLDQDLSPQPTNFGVTRNPAVLLNERLLLSQPATDIVGEEILRVTLGRNQDIDRLIFGNSEISNNRSELEQLRFRADELEFFDDRWEAKNVRITNDPFSPPELQLVAETASYQMDELVTTQTRLVIDETISLPVFPRTVQFGEASTGAFGFLPLGYDDENRGGLFLQRPFTPYRSAQGRWRVTPQYLLQKALFPDMIESNRDDEDAGKPLSPGVFALSSDFRYRFNPRLAFTARGFLDSLRLSDLENNLRMNLRLEQKLGDLDNPFRLSQEFNYRNRLFNGSLGFQRVQRSLGIVLRSPRYRLGDSGFGLDFQASIQNIEADTDRPELLEPGVSQDEISLTRYQGALNLDHRLPLWRGEPLPSTRLEGLRYSPRPVVPYISLVTGFQGVGTSYSSGDRQNVLRGRIGLEGQFGHFADNSLDYTGFNISYSNSFLSDELSPFLFDRAVDQRTLEFGLTQQIYGPLRAGFQTAINLDSKEAISTDYFLEYSRRTHSVSLRYNPVLEIGSINFTINGFNWSGSTDPFVNQEVRSVNDGVIP